MWFDLVAAPRLLGANRDDAVWPLPGTVFGEHSDAVRPARGSQGGPAGRSSHGFVNTGSFVAAFGTTSTDPAPRVLSQMLTTVAGQDYTLVLAL